MKLQIILLLFVSIALVIGNNSTGRRNLTIEGIPATAVQEFEELMRNAHQGVITKWVDSLPSDQQTIANSFFADREKTQPTIDI